MILRAGYAEKVAAWWEKFAEETVNILFLFY